MTIDELRKVMQYSNEILEVVDNADQFTRSDLQGVVDALVHKIVRETKHEKTQV